MSLSWLMTHSMKQFLILYYICSLMWYLFFYLFPEMSLPLTQSQRLSLSLLWESRASVIILIEIFNLISSFFITLSFHVYSWLEFSLHVHYICVCYKWIASILLYHTLNNNIFDLRVICFSCIIIIRLGSLLYYSYHELKGMEFDQL